MVYNLGSRWAAIRVVCAPVCPSVVVPVPMLIRVVVLVMTVGVVVPPVMVLTAVVVPVVVLIMSISVVMFTVMIPVAPMFVCQCKRRDGETYSQYNHSLKQTLHKFPSDSLALPEQRRRVLKSTLSAKN
jgi:hypothetical protein